MLITYCLVNRQMKGKYVMSIINIEEIRSSCQLKKEKYNEAKAAIKDILSAEQLKEFDGVFDEVVGKVFKGVLMKKKA